MLLIAVAPRILPLDLPHNKVVNKTSKCPVLVNSFSDFQIAVSCYNNNTPIPWFRLWFGVCNFGECTEVNKPRFLINNLRINYSSIYLWDSLTGTMNNYIQRIGFTVWRRKTTIIIIAGFLAFLIFGVNFIKVPEKDDYMKEERDAQVVADALLRSINVKFIETVNRIKGNGNKRGTDAPKNEQEEDATNKDSNRVEELETEQQLGIPYVNLDPKHPYVPKKRIVHFDLKGAPPLVGYFKRMFPLIKNMGATGILMGISLFIRK